MFIHSASQLLTLSTGPQRGGDLGTLNIIHDGAVAIQDGRFTKIGETAELLPQVDAEVEIDASGQVVMPGFVDPHTHLIWVGDRSAEFKQRIAGATYMEIMAAGGGIMSTVRQTRAASVEQMMAEARPRMTRMLRHGTTTAEAKTGYGLNTDTEISMLETIRRLKSEKHLELVPTFLGAHTIPEEFSQDPDAYVDLLCNEMIPEVQRWWERSGRSEPKPFIDVFCETGAFSLEQSRRILTTARDLGFPLKIHADEFEGLGGTGLAIELGAISADHLVHTPAEDIAALGRSDTVAVALPCTPFGLAENDYTPAKAIIDAGGILAIATDLNPGTAWCESMQFAIALACRYMHLTPSQAIAAGTINAAAALGLSESVGSISTEKQADLIILDAPDYGYLGYRFGINLVSCVVKRGKVLINTLKQENLRL
ncbi:MAG: imidazolonepropionase [Anaerolineales bacterium]|nr:imidazolonepropionase [Anaerolineales bacterium]